jgi:hypothetical protein
MTAAVAALLGVWLLLVAATPLSAQGEHEKLLEEIEQEVARTVERPYSLGGFLEFQPILFDLDRDSAFYRLNFYDRDEGDLLAQYNIRSRLEGSYRRGILSLFARGDLRLRYDYQGWDE